jgi:hypothetical protein
VAKNLFRPKITVTDSGNNSTQRPEIDRQFQAKIAVSVGQEKGQNSPMNADIFEEKWVMGKLQSFYGNFGEAE